MQFYGDLASNVPLRIPVLRLDSYFATEIPVRIGGKRPSFHGEVVRPFRRVNQEMLIDQTRLFIELVQ